MQHTPKHIKDVGGYIYFSPNTKGTSGRPVKIHTNLFVDFFCAVNPEAHDGQTIIRDIESLKSQQAPDFRPIAVAPKRAGKSSNAQHMQNLERIDKTLSAMTNQRYMTKERIFVTKNVRIFYHIDQKDGDATQTVYISEVKVRVNESPFPGGLYEYRTSSLSTKIQKSNDSQLNGKFAFISGATDSPQKAMKNAVYFTGDHKPSLFFTPSEVREDIRIGKENRLKESTQTLVADLAKILTTNHKKQIAWFVEGEGASLLSEALGRVDVKLDQQQFTFINAKTSMSDLLKRLDLHNAKLENESIRYASDKTALLALAFDANNVLAQLRRLPVPAGYENISRRYLFDQIKALSTTGKQRVVAEEAKSLRGRRASFIEVLRQVYGG